jgi:hypothetical protein
VLLDQQNVRPIKELLQTLYRSLCGLVQDIGKSVLVGDKLGSLDPERYTTKNVPFNYYTTSAVLQRESGLHLAARSPSSTV